MPGKPIKKPVSQAQQRFFGAELGRLRAGKPTQTGISEKELSVKAATPKGKKLPHKVGKGQSMGGGMPPGGGPIAPAAIPRRRGVPAATVPGLGAKPPGGMPAVAGRKLPAPVAGASKRVARRQAPASPFRGRAAPPPPR